MVDSDYRRDWIKAYGRSLVRRHSPRLEMFLIFSATSASGFLASRLLLLNGIDRMALRYPLSALIAYIVFLCFVGMWVRLYSLRELPHDADFSLSASAARRRGSDHSWLDGFDLPIDFDEGWVFFMLLAVAVVLLLVAGWIIVEAPALLAELLLESSIVGALYPALRGGPHVGWLRSVCRRTAVPMLIVLATFTLFGIGMQAYAPGARSVGEMIRHESSRP